MSTASPDAAIVPPPPDIRPFAEIARGPVATVFKAVDQRTGAVVLLKTLRGHDPERRRRFADEARLASQVAHPNVVRVLDAWDGAMVAEWVEGADLGHVLAEVGALPPALAAFVVRQAAQGLAAIHEAGILHRDISAANLLLGADGTVKLADFGLASLVDAPDAEVRGTLGTLAPEVIRGDAPTARADLFSLGAVLAQALSGRPAFGGDTPAATLDAVLHDDPTAALAADPRIPSALVEIAAALLAKDPADRPASAADTADRLTAVLARLGAVGEDDLAAFLDDPATYQPPEPPVVPDPPLIPAPLAPPRRQSGRRWALAGLLVVALVAVIVTLAFPGAPTASDPPAATDEPLAAPAVEIADRTAPLNPADDAPEVDEADAVAAPPTMPPEGIEGRPAPAPQEGAPPSLASPPPSEPTPPETAPPSAPRVGRLAIAVEPWARVRVGGRDIGTTPVDVVSLPPGEHVVTLLNPDFPPHTVRVQVEADRQVTRTISLWDTVGRIQIEVHPWARVSVDGEDWDTIPPQTRPLILAPGDHRLGFEHPTLGTREVRLRVAAGERRTVRVRMGQEE